MFCYSRETSFGLLRYYQPKERIVPFYKNRYYQLLWGKRKASVCVNICLFSSKHSQLIFQSLGQISSNVDITNFKNIKNIKKRIVFAKLLQMLSKNIRIYVMKKIAFWKNIKNVSISNIIIFRNV